MIHSLKTSNAPGTTRSRNIGIVIFHVTLAWLDSYALNVMTRTQTTWMARREGNMNLTIQVNTYTISRVHCVFYREFSVSFSYFLTPDLRESERESYEGGSWTFQSKVQSRADGHLAGTKSKYRLQTGRRLFEPVVSKPRPLHPDRFPLAERNMEG